MGNLERDWNAVYIAKDGSSDTNYVAGKRGV